MKIFNFFRPVYTKLIIVKTYIQFKVHSLSNRIGSWNLCSSFRSLFGRAKHKQEDKSHPLRFPGFTPKQETDEEKITRAIRTYVDEDMSQEVKNSLCEFLPKEFHNFSQLPIYPKFVEKNEDFDQIQSNGPVTLALTTNNRVLLAINVVNHEGKVSNIIFTQDLHQQGINYFTPNPLLWEELRGEENQPKFIKDGVLTDKKTGKLLDNHKNGRSTCFVEKMNCLFDNKSATDIYKVSWRLNSTF